MQSPPSLCHLHARTCIHTMDVSSVGRFPSQNELSQAGGDALRWISPAQREFLAAEADRVIFKTSTRVRAVLARACTSGGSGCFWDNIHVLPSPLSAEVLAESSASFMAAVSMGSSQSTPTGTRLSSSVLSAGWPPSLAPGSCGAPDRLLFVSTNPCGRPGVGRLPAACALVHAFEAPALACQRRDTP